LALQVKSVDHGHKLMEQKYFKGAVANVHLVGQT